MFSWLQHSRCFLCLYSCCMDQMMGCVYPCLSKMSCVYVQWSFIAQSMALPPGVLPQLAVWIPLGQSSCAIKYYLNKQKQNKLGDQLDLEVLVNGLGYIWTELDEQFLPVSSPCVMISQPACDRSFTFNWPIWNWALGRRGRIRISPTCQANVSFSAVIFLLNFGMKKEDCKLL